MTIATRPPRPVHVPADLMAAMTAATGMAAHEILDVREHRQGHVVDLHDGTAVIVLAEGEADALGQTGVLHYSSGRPETHRGVRVYADPDAPRAQQAAASDPWTLEDLHVAADKLGQLPPAVQGQSGPTRLGWVGGDPVRAFAVLRHHAKQYDGNVRAAAAYSAEAATCREIVLASGWLAPHEARGL